MRFAAVLGLFFAFLSSSSLAADKISKLSEDNITAFIEETTALTSDYDAGFTPDEIRRYLEAHIDKKARFKSTVTYAIPNHPPQSQSLGLDKDEFINQTVDGQKSLEHYETAISVDKVSIAKSGKNATVVTSGIESGYMSVPSGDGMVNEVPVEGSSKCIQIIKLNKGVIQMYSANCTTTIEFQAY